VYSPALSTCLGAECNKPFGQVDVSTLPPMGPSKGPGLPAQLTIGQESFGVDAALIQVLPSASAVNVVPEIGQIVDTRDLIQEWNLSASVQNAPKFIPPTIVVVRKYGSIEPQFTTGTIAGLMRQQVAGVTGAGALVLNIAVDPTQKPFSQEYDLNMAGFLADPTSTVKTVQDVLHEFTAPMSASQTGDTSIQVQGPSFSQPGDSGAPIVDKDNKIIGLVVGGTFVKLHVQGKQSTVLINTGNSQAIFIEAALQGVGATFLKAGQPSAGATVVVPGIALAIHQRETFESSEWEREWRKVANTPGGQRISDVLKRHFDEVSQLVHHDRRVKLAWHRNKGPAFAAALIGAAGRSESPMPEQIDGVRREDGIRAMREALMASGSARLRASIVEHGDDFTALLNGVPPEIVTTREAMFQESVP